MKRTARTALTLTLALLFGFIGLAWSQVPAQRVIIMDATGTHAASVSGGNLGTSASVTVDNIAHITSALHVAGIAQTVAVNCVTGCSASVGVTGSTHISVALHVAGTINGAQFHIQGLGIPGQAHGGVLTIQGVTGGVPVAISGSISAGDAVNVFHQSTIRHISSVIHIQSVGRLGVDAHQGGEWNVRHITSVVHVAGAIRIQDMTCPTCTARVDHYNALVVQPHISGAFRAWRVSQCGTTARTLVATNTGRRDLYIQNLGGPIVTPSNSHYNLYLGFGVTGHVALTAGNGWTLHAMSYLVNPTTTTLGPGNFGPTTQLILPNYQGPVSCVTATTTGTSVGILEILR